MNFSHLLWRHFSFPPVIPSCYSVPSRPVFLGKWKKGQQIRRNLLLANGFFPNSETSVTLKGFMHLFEGKIERPSPKSGFYKWKTSRYTRNTRIEWESFGKGGKFSSIQQMPYRVSAHLFQAVVTRLYRQLLDAGLEYFCSGEFLFVLSALNMAGSFPGVYLWNSTKLSLYRIISLLYQR